MPRWKAAWAGSKPSSCTKLAIQPEILRGTTCLRTSKDTTIASGFILPSGISPPMRQSAAPLDPVSTKSGEGQFTTLMRFDSIYYGHFKCNLRRLVDYPNLWAYTRDLFQTTGIGETVNLGHA